MPEYILITYKGGNFISQSVLIPYQEFLSSQPQWYDSLKNLSEKNVKFLVGGVEFVVDNLIVQNYTRENGKLVRDFCQINEFVDKLPSYDEVNNTIKGIISYGSNDIVDYCNMRNLKSHKGTNVRIVESYLILDSYNGNLTTPRIISN